MPGTDLKKKREIVFAKFPPGQVPEAADDLQRMEDLEVRAKYEERALGVSYDLQQHTLRELDEHLVDKGYHLDNTLLSKLIRAFVHYVEETELHNLEADGERPRNKSQNQAYTQAWERHPHGDHDTTPPEWREYK